MTREEALQILDTIPTIGEQVDALEMAIECLQSSEMWNGTTTDKRIFAPKGTFQKVFEDGKAEPCDDYISKKDTIEWLKKVTVTEGIEFKTGFEQIIYDIEQMPPVTPTRPKGEWIRHKKVEDVYSIDGVKTWGIKHQCNKCGFTTVAIEDFGYYDFCPNCGADMRGDADERTDEPV